MYQSAEFCREKLTSRSYASRVPELVRRIASKMGVSFDVSPKKHRLTSSKKKAVAPGTKVQRLHQAKVKRPLLAQALVNDKENTRPPSLLRSATDSFLLSTKRGKSATPSILQDNRRALSRSNSIVQTKQVAQREVDMRAIAKFNETKSRKKVDTEQSLKEAIAALKKPNRGLAIKDYVDEADQRRSSAASNHNSKLPSCSAMSVIESISLTIS